MLPFANLSSDPQQEYFSDCITYDLVTDLSRVPKLFVIARTSSFTYKGKAEKVQTMSGCYSTMFDAILSTKDNVTFQ